MSGWRQSGRVERQVVVEDDEDEDDDDGEALGRNDEGGRGVYLNNWLGLV